LPVYPYIQPNTVSLIFPWYPFRGQAPQFKVHLRIRLSGCGLPATPLQPYRDLRVQVSAYFAISCASATGSSLTRFMSNPNVRLEEQPLQAGKCSMAIRSPTLFCTFRV
jgi:hypothetical protein